MSVLEARLIVRIPAILLAIALSSTPASAISWVEQGPGPDLNGQAEGILNKPVSGAINAIAVDPTNPLVTYVGTVNGGVWKSVDGNATWKPLTDLRLPEQSIRSLAISPANPKWIFAGTGSTSAEAFEGSDGFGVARSTNAGSGWKVLAKSTFEGRVIVSIVPTAINKGKVILAATLFDNGGVYRSVDTGTHFTRLSGDGASGLPDQGVSSLVGDPGDPMRFYAAVPQKTGVGATGAEQVYTSTDGGVSWAPLNTGLTGLNTSLRILLSVHNSLGMNAVYAMIISTSGNLQGVFRSENHGAWISMSLPPTDIFPGVQGIIHGAIAADPSDPHAVFISGDRQASPFPNVNGCNEFSASVFRGTAFNIPTPGATWDLRVCNGAAGTSPHADARVMVFDASGNILHGCDGGLYKLVLPDSAPVWVSQNGNLRPSEMHSVAYDPVGHAVFGGLQDNGSTMQFFPTGNPDWGVWFGGDGGNVAIDHDQTAHPGTSIRYTSSQFFSGFNRSTWDSGNNNLGASLVGLHITSGGGSGSTLSQADGNIQFYNPYVLNSIDPSRMLIGTANLYESMDKGDSLANLGFQSQFIKALAYGGRLGGVAKADVFYAGTAGSNLIATPTVLHRVNVGDPITSLTAYPGSDARSMAIDPQNYKNVFVLDNQSRVWASRDEGASWTEFTSNLAKLTDEAVVLEVFNPGGTKDLSVLILGGASGAFQLKKAATTTKPKWSKLSSKLPHVQVSDLHYDYTNNVLVAGTLGRGAWTLTGFFPGGKVPRGSALAVQSVQSRSVEVGPRLLDVAPLPPVARLVP